MGTTQNELTDALTSAISAIADSSAQSKEATLTIEAEIVDIIDEGLGTYTIKYLGNTFSASTTHNQITYQKGDMVYVLVPNGDFDKSKVILSPIVPSVGGYVASSMASSGSTYINISDNLFKRVNDISLCSWKTVEPSSSASLTDNTGFGSLIQGALKDSRVFNFTCKIRTDIEEERRSRGNYGLELHIPVLQSVNGQSEKTEYVVKIDTNNITGDPYNLQVPTLQNIYFTLPDNMSYYNDTSTASYYNTPMVPWIGYFVKDFVGQDNTKPDDIFITDIQLLSVLEIDEETTPGYYATINATEGNSFLVSRTGDTKTLSVITYLNGKVTRNDDFACYWFKENMGIDPSNEKFHEFGGRGWEVLNKVKSTSYLEDGKPIYEYVTNDYTQKISQSDIHIDTKFKCVLIKDLGTENPIKIEAFVVIKNLENNAILELSTENGSTTFSSGVGNVVLQLKYYEAGITDQVQSEFNVNYSWKRVDKFGNFVDDFNYTTTEFNKKSGATYITKISYPVSKIDEFNTFYCTVSVSKNNRHLVTTQIIGTVSLTINIGQFLNGHIEIINGDKIYKYDADGNSPMSDGQYSGPLSSFITTIDPIQIKIYKGDGNEFTSSEYAVTDVSWLVPIKSMIALTSEQQADVTTNPGYYTITGKYNVNSQLIYKIANTYNPNKSDNAIIIKVSTPSSILKDPLTAIANINFLKDGEGGTNGTNYSAVITYKGYGYGQGGHKLQLIYIADGIDDKKWYIYDPGDPSTTYTPFVDNNVTFSAALYLGNLVSSSSSATWSLFDAGHYKDTSYTSATSPVTINSNGKLSLNGKNMTGSSDVFCTIIQAKIRCNTGSQDAPLDVYAYYPIECVYISKINYLNSFIPTLDGGFSKVLYNSDGSNPQYDNSLNFKVNNVLYDDISEFFYCEWSKTPNIATTSVNLDMEIKGTPVAKFDNGLSNNYIKTLLRSDTAHEQKLTAKITALNNNITSINNQITYYQSLQNNLNIFTSFNNSYSYYKNLLLETISFYSVKNNLVETVKDLLLKAEELSTTCYTYRTKEDGSIDFKVNNIYNDIRTKIITLENLNDLCIVLGVENVIDQIKAISSSSLLVTRISFEEELPERDCYYTINSIIDLYNSVLSTYEVYVTYLNNSDIIYGDEISQSVIAWLNNFASSNELDNLTKTYSGYNIECYRYTGLIKVLEGYVTIASEQTSDYNSMIENVLNPIFNNVAWYISFTNDGGYSSIISDLNNQLSNLNTELTKLNGIAAIVSEMKIYGISTISLCKPIVFTYNRYEMSFLNGWDGNKLETGDGYIIAPQVGAGIKNNDNSFTGIVLGVKQIKERDSNSKVGLFGYNYGIQTLFLNARDGSATFGRAGSGQIIIEPKQEAIIKSGNYNEDTNRYLYEELYPQPTSWRENPAELGYYEYGYDSTQAIYTYIHTTDNYPNSNKTYYKKINDKGGMLINLTKPEIRFGTGNFIVSKEGHITAKGGGNIAGWNINDTQIYKNNLYIDSGTEKTTTNTQGQQVSYTSYGIYSGTSSSSVHDTISSTKSGFYLGPSGLSISNSTRSRIELNVSGDPVIYSGNHYQLSETTKGFYLSQDGLSISNGSQSRIELNTSGNPVIYSGSHNQLSETVRGFYLGQDGLSISNGRRSRIELSTTGDPVIYSGSHNSLDSTDRGFYLGQEGLSISNGGRSRIELSTTGDPVIYSSSHSSLTSTNSGFYLSSDGLSIGSKVYIDDDGIMRLGRGAVANTGKHWVIDGTSSGSSISYVSVDGSGNITESVYIGTDAIKLGAKRVSSSGGGSGGSGELILVDDPNDPEHFNGGSSSGGIEIENSEETDYAFSVDNKGKLKARDAEISGKIEATTGKIAGWTIDGSTLKSNNGTVKLNAEGSHSIEGNSSYIDLGGGGDFEGCHINGSKVVFSVSDIGVTRYRNDTNVLGGHTGDLTVVTSVDFSTGGVGTVTIPFVHGLWVN